MKKWIGLALIGVMLFSSVAFAGIQSFYSGQPAQATQTTPNQLPAQQIVDYSLNADQLNLALTSGLTVATYTYDKSCVQCADERRLVEQIIQSKDFQNQIILEEIVGSGASKLAIESYLGKKTLDSITQNATVQTLCDLVVSPPLGCVAAKAAGT